MNSIRCNAKTPGLGTPRTGAVHIALVVTVTVVSVVAATAAYYVGQHSTTGQHSTGGRQATAEANPDGTPGSNAATAFPKFETVINKPAGPPRVFTGLLDVHGQPVTVSCSTCHATRTANYDNRTAKDLNEFHVNIDVAHGSISCLACHNEENYDTLKLADNTPVDYTEVMQLCGQCHGPQLRDFQHGAHGGMTGYWDRTRGPQMKNNCVDCHHPHRPQFPQMTPTFKPRDRFLDTGQQEH